MKSSVLARLLVAFCCPLAAVVIVTPVAAQTRPPAGFAAYWVRTTTATSLWSGSGTGATEFGPLPVAAILQVVAAPQNRLNVWNPLTNSYAWVNAEAVEPISPPATEELAALRSFEPWWAMTHRPATSWSSNTAEAEPRGEIIMWRYLEVLTPVYGGRVLTRDPRTDALAFVDTATIGPVGPPPDEYFADAPADIAPIGLPGRVIRETDLFDRPDRADYFSTDRVQINRPVQAEGLVTGEDGTDWYRLGDGQYAPSAAVRLPSKPDRTFEGRWIDASLSEPVMVTAYEDEQPVYTALAVKGTVAFQTPTGVFRILRRVENETMDSLTIGIPREEKDGYYLKDVLFTQYFSGDGAALHYNYWRSTWGASGSHGCLGMDYDDSLFFWEFAKVGTPVYVHE